MPGRLRVKILAARNLPVMDRASFSTDAFVELKLGNNTVKTDVFRKSLNPQWNTEWFKFELDDEELQDEALQIRVLDHDTYSAHDAIGKVYIDLNPLHSKGGTSNISGWFPIYDTMHGIRGEINLTIKIELINDLNQFRQSSLGVRFFHCPGIPAGYSLVSLIGFVEELVVNDDPEYQWFEKIRSSRSSNEARQRLFSKLSGQLQRKLGVRVLEMSGNAVIGYHLHFDLEGDTGIVVRGIGTAALLKFKELSANSSFISSTTTADKSNRKSNIAERDTDLSSKSDNLSVQHPNVSFDDSACQTGIFKLPPHVKSTLASNSNPLDVLDQPFLTMSIFPPGLITSIGGVVSVKSIKLLDRIHNPDTPETRDAWWSELRTEIRSHMRALGCHIVVGYSEETCISDELMVLMASGTAAELDLNFERSAAEADISPTCRFAHALYSSESAPFPVSLSRCGVCGKGNVPDILFSTIDLPEEAAVLGTPALIQARIWKIKKENKGEATAKEISDRFPFIEYELHNQLMNKVKLRGMNALFGLKTRLSLVDDGILVTGTGTGVYLMSLPAPCEPKLSSKTDSGRNLGPLQDKALEFLSRSREVHGLNVKIPAKTVEAGELAGDDLSVSQLELSSSGRDTYIIELSDECEEDDLSVLLLDYPLGEHMQLSTSRCTPRSGNSILFTRVFRCPLEGPGLRQVSSLLGEFLQATCFGFRHQQPCTLIGLDFHPAITDDSILQVILTGLCVCHKQETSPSSTRLGMAADITLTPCVLSSPPLAYLGNLDFFFIRETTSVREIGGLAAFLHACISEVQAVVRAHARALGGHAVTSYHLSEVILLDNSSRGQAQCLLNVCGDVVQLRE